MTDDQFVKLLKELSNNQKDHDLLIEIKTLLKTDKEETLRHRAVCQEQFGCIKRDTKAAHARIDKIGISLLVTVLVALVSVFLR